jgi:hypothetical protein
MPSWFSRPKQEDPSPEPEPEEIDIPEWDSVEEEEPQDEEEVAETRLQAALQDRVKGLKDRLATHGLDLSDEGDPVIRDPKRFRDWARPAVMGSNTGDAPPNVRPVTPEPEPVTPEPVQRGQDPEMWEMTPDQFRAAIREEAEKIAKPLQDQLAQQRGLVGRKYVDDATQKTADALAAVAPDYVHIMDHPQFDELFRKQLESMPPEWLESPQVLASTALGLVAWMDADQMPDRAVNLDDKSARAAVNRSLVPQSRGGQDQSSNADRGYSDEYAKGSRWLADKRVARIAPEEMAALDAVDERGLHTIDEYVRAKKRIDKAKGKR